MIIQFFFLHLFMRTFYDSEKNINYEIHVVIRIHKNEAQKSEGRTNDQ